MALWCILALPLPSGNKNDVYKTMAAKVENAPARQLFHQLSQIELNHQNRILEQFAELTGKSVTRETFETRQVTEVLEGGLTNGEKSHLARLGKLMEATLIRY
jgi:rubrerythrin